MQLALRLHASARGNRWGCARLQGTNVLPCEHCKVQRQHCNCLRTTAGASASMGVTTDMAQEQ